MSITSMNARMGMAEKLDIPQLTKAIQDGTVPSFIGIPLLQQKMQQSKTAQAMAQPKAPPVAQQVMQQAEAMQQPQGLTALPSQMPQEYAAGGILSYAGGGNLAAMYLDDEDDEDQDYVNAMIRGLEMPDMSQQDENHSPGIETLTEAKVSPSGRNFEIKESKVENEDGALAKLHKHILHKESRGQRYNKEGNLLTSSKGALGEMQVMPATARDPGFGVTPARSNDPEELRRVGDEYAKVLLNKYRDPKLAAIAYNMGPGRTDKWLTSGADMSALPAETRGYIQGMAGGGAVHFQNRGIVNDPAADPNTMNQIDILGRELDEARSQFKAMRLPGQRQLQADPSLQEKYNAARDRVNALQQGYENLMSSTGMNQAAFGQYRGALGSQPPKANPIVQTMSAPAATPFAGNETPDIVSNAYGVSALIPAKTSATPFAGTETPDLAPGGYGSSTTQTEAPATGATEQTAQANPASAIEELLAKREAGLGKQRDIDNYMALLSAGLGIMGGTSPFAAANIGQGAQAGIKTYGDAAARNAAEQNAILSGRLGLEKYKRLADIRREQQEQNNLYRQEQINVARERLKSGELGKQEANALKRETKELDYIKSAQERALTAAAKAVGDSPNAMTMSETQKAEAIRAMSDRLLMPDKIYRKYYQTHHEIDPYANMGGGGTRLKFDAQGQEIK